MYSFYITSEDRKILRELAKKQLEYSQLPVMKERMEQWYKHNECEGERPMIHVEIWTFERDIIPELKCQTATGRTIELELYRNFINYERIDDDRIVPPYYSIRWDTWFQLFGVTIEKEHAVNSKGDDLGHRFKYIINDLEEDFPKLGPSKYGVDREKTLAWKEFLENIFGDILPVKIAGNCLVAVPTQDIVHMMGMENMLFSMYDYPDTFHALMKRITDDYIEYFKWLETEGLLLPAASYELCNQGTFCFTRELPQEPVPGKKLATKDSWGYMDSQETVGISPDMYEEFIFPYYKRVSDLFGLFSYGCCEPVDPVWDNCLSKCENLRKISISPWCNEEAMGEKLKGRKVIYHRKPSPNFIGVGKDLDEEAWRQHIIKTLKAAQGCHLEITQRDVYSLGGDVEKPRKAVRIIRECIDEYWK
ncbi:MAG TPA: hypothetical protein GXX36_16020 [Clostridiaceae bacterium]|nr:hypothetical protein [Clostridiaceae bacterium]